MKQLINILWKIMEFYCIGKEEWLIDLMLNLVEWYNKNFIRKNIEVPQEIYGQLSE